MGAVLLQHGKPIAFHSETFNGAVVNYPTYDKELYTLVQSVKIVETLFDGQRNCYTYRPSTLTVLAITKQVTTVTTLQMDGLLATVPFGNKVQERYFE